MNLYTLNPFRALSLVPLTALWLASVWDSAQSALEKVRCASVLMGQM